jgi:hypothetical protein
VVVLTKYFNAVSIIKLNKTIILRIVVNSISQIKGRTGAEGVKRPGPEADHSTPTRAEVKKFWIYSSIPSYTYMV